MTIPLHEEAPVERPFLIVDLDGTLLRSDLLFETFWSAFASDWRSPVRAAAALRAGRPALKRHLVEASAVEVATLPYDAEVLAHVREWRERGGRTALVTASDERLARRIADHLGIFDEVHGSDGTRNLKGAVKAAFLTERFGDRGYVYMGDAAADLPVWERAGKAITVNASGALRRRVEALGGEVEHLGASGMALAPYLKALRPHQWLKNILVFLPMIAGHRYDIATFGQSLLAFVAFSLVASSVYVLNDLLDLSADRAHPRKSRRPFASGSVPIAHGSWMAPGLLGLGALVAASLGWLFLGVMAVYFASTTAYSLYLKRRTVVDIVTLACLYTMRIIAGGVATGIALSVWLLAFSVFFFFALAAVKRQAELVDGVKRGQFDTKGRGYHVDDLPLISQFAVAAGYVSVLVMALYVNSPAVGELYGYPAALWGICLILLYWISRIVMVTHRGWMHDDPIVYAVKDRISRICVTLMVGVVLAATFL
jgi:4-hydroxybenzoate polyprenyltransferase/phosphoserine phosphatase